MPNGDGTGPCGQGPMSGRGRGRCATRNENRGFGRGNGRGNGRGAGACWLLGIGLVTAVAATLLAQADKPRPSTAE